MPYRLRKKRGGELYNKGGEPQKKCGERTGAKKARKKKKGENSSQHTERSKGRKKRGSLE